MKIQVKINLDNYYQIKFYFSHWLQHLMNSLITNLKQSISENYTKKQLSIINTALKKHKTFFEREILRLILTNSSHNFLKKWALLQSSNEDPNRLILFIFSHYSNEIITFIEAVIFPNQTKRISKPKKSKLISIANYKKVTSN